MITDFTIISALINKLIIEKSALLASPTDCDAISASICYDFTLNCVINLANIDKLAYSDLYVSLK